ncbi:MAG: hypothetical protein APR55_00670 [Methanolinea sp. SDB]|nr:MAG: hypothetical protein APR55_00670 [Methanolinea sp. SDB]
MVDPGKNHIGPNDLHHTADRWMRARRALHAADRDYAEELVGMIRIHEDDDMAMIRDPLEAAVFAVLIEMMKRGEQG